MTTVAMIHHPVNAHLTIAGSSSSCLPNNNNNKDTHAVQYTLCATFSSVTNATAILKSSPYITIDCEGHNFGRIGGTLSLISVGTPNADNIFLFDVPALLSIKSQSIDPFAPLAQIFSATDIQKIVWDGRMDWLELRETCQLPLEPVLDLQLVALSITQDRRANPYERLLKLRQVFPTTQIKKYKKLYDDLEIVVGLQRCLEDNNLLDSNSKGGKDPSIVKMHQNNECSRWMERPLDQALLNYAANDIYLISSLYEHFKNTGNLPRRKLERFLKQSQRYVRVHEERGKAEKGDIFCPGNVMPLGVLKDSGEPRYKCSACMRTVSLPYFNTRRDGQQRLRQSRCRLCAAIALKYMVPDHMWLVT